MLDARPATICSTEPSRWRSRGDGFAEAAAAQSRDISGTVRVTTEEVYAITLLAPMLRELHEQHPEILIELDTSQAVRDLGAGEADISCGAPTGETSPRAGGRRLWRRRLDALLQPRLRRPPRRADNQSPS